MDEPGNDQQLTSDEPVRQRFVSELLDAVALRTFLLVLGVLAIQLAFVLSYVGAFHHPTPHRVAIVVVAPAQLAAQVVTGLNALPGMPLQATAAGSAAIGRAELRRGTTNGVFIVNPAAPRDDLLVASGGGAATATAIETVIARTESAAHRAATVDDVVPTQAADARGLTGFYLVIGWLVGGYLVAALLGVAAGARPATTRRAVIRLLALVPYAIVSGLGGALIVGPVLGALTGHLVALWGVGALLVFSAAAVTLAFQVLLGTIGVGLTVVLFVVLGNPSAGGAYPANLLPPFWRAISSALPNGAGVSAVRRITYFGANDVGTNLVVVACYLVGGVAVAVSGAALLARRDAASGRAKAALV